VKKLGIILTIVAAVAAIPLVALAWQGPDLAPGSSWGRHGGPTHMDSGSFGWGRMGHWMDPTAAQNRAAASPAADLPSQRMAAPTPKSAGLLDPPTTPDDTVWAGCPMWGDLYPNGLPDGYLLPDYPNGTVPPGYGPGGCPMWGGNYPDGLPGTAAPPETERYGNGWGGHMWGHGMMHGGW
jgi:hypothetical protein